MADSDLVLPTRQMAARNVGIVDLNAQKERYKQQMASNKSRIAQLEKELADLKASQQLLTQKIANCDAGLAAMNTRSVEPDRGVFVPNARLK